MRSFISFLTLISLSTWAAPVAVPGTKVSLEPPEGFTLAKQFPGFAREDLFASIMITEMPAPVAEIKKAMTKENLQTKGMVLLESNIIQHAGKEALLLGVHQSAAGKLFRKWMLVTGEANSTTMVVGTFPDEADAQIGAPIKRAVLSASIDALGAKDVFEGLLFRIEQSEKLKIAGRIANMLMLNESGSTTPAAPGAPLYVIGNSVSQTAIDDLPAFARARAANTAQVKDLREIKGKAIKLGGLNAYELIADAADAKSGGPIKFYQVIAPDGENYFIVQGLVAAARAGEYVPEFQRITGSFKQTR